MTEEVEIPEIVYVCGMSDYGTLSHIVSEMEWRTEYWMFLYAR